MVKWVLICVLTVARLEFARLRDCDFRERTTSLPDLAVKYEPGFRVNSQSAVGYRVQG